MDSLKKELNINNAKKTTYLRVFPPVICDFLLSFSEKAVARLTGHQCPK